jgi:predicted nucleotidyltransferase component of viral defense system
MIKQKTPKNIGASVRARLLKVAKETQQDYNAILNRYVQERLLYRISISEHNKDFILKGALLFLSYNMPVSRPTKDIDFLGRNIKNDIQLILKIILGIVSIELDDGVNFNGDEIAVEVIKEMNEYKGIRCKVPGNVGGASFRIQLDIAFGDKIIPQPNEINFPVMLDFPVPVLWAYSLESAVAEKFEAIVKLNFLTSRMKDFYDIVFLSTQYEFHSIVLRQAIFTTFNVRGTDIATGAIIFSRMFIEDERLNRQWLAFANRQLKNDKRTFPEIIAALNQFLMPVLKRDGESSMVWSCETRIWYPVK